MLTTFNHWWIENSVRKKLKGKKRRITDKIIDYIDNRQILIIKGLRRVGKTTILYQIIDNLITVKKVNKLNIIYYSFDKKVENIDKIFNEYKQNIIKRDFIENDRYYIIFDEIQKLDDWTNKIKIYYDLYPNFKFILSGSAALELLKNSKESLAGRAFYFKIDPLDFDEYLQFKSIGIDKEHLYLYKEILEIELNNYMNNCGFIEMINETNMEVLYKYFYESIIERIIFQDIPRVFSLKEPELFLRLIEIISYNAGLIVDYKNIGNDLKRDQRTISLYFEYLNRTYIIKKMYNYSKNRITSEKKLKKFYLSYPAFIFNKDNKSKIFENLIISFSNTNFFYRSSNIQEVDMIIIDNNVIIPVEIKYKDNIKRTDKRGVMHVMKKFNVKESYIITKNFKYDENTKYGTVKYIPGYEYLIQKFN